MLFRKDIEPRCSYCSHGKKLGENELTCRHRGITSPGSSCRHFKYDPLKRIPPKPVRLITKGLSDEDFKL
jgi:hypothetical protein